MMEKRHRCKLCFRNFANGKALGGHMRSHMMKFYAAQKLREQEEEQEQEHAFNDFQSNGSYSSTSPSSSSSEDEEEEEESADQVKGKSTLLVDHHEFAASAVALQDGESETETESLKQNAICRRSKRVRKSRVSGFDRFMSMNDFFQVKKKSKFENKEQGTIKNNNNNNDYSSLSSISDTTPEEHVAHCLIMLSRDKWQREEIEYQEEEDDDEKLNKFGDDDIKSSSNKVRGKYRCEECNKLFRSYQALGGHRASHKRIKVEAAAPAINAASGGGAPQPAAAAEKVHECPFCQRIFSSGQALGGHKRSHFVGGGGANVNNNIIRPAKEKSRIGEILLNIDLNLPAPVDDDDEDDVAVSAVSDAEFVYPIKG